MKAADAYAAAEKKVYGSEKDSTLPPRDPQRYLQDVTLDFLKLAQDNEVIALNPSGFAKASILRQEGIPTITYSEEYDANQDKYVVVKSKSHDELSPGEYAFDPVESLFLYKNKGRKNGKSALKFSTNFQLWVAKHGVSQLSSVFKFRPSPAPRVWI